MTQSPKRVVSVLLSLIVLSAGFLDYWSYSQTFYQEPGIWMDVVSGTANAPSQYRIGVIDTAYFLARHTHFGLRHTLALLDVIAGLIAVFTLFLVSCGVRRFIAGRAWGGSGLGRRVLWFWFSFIWRGCFGISGRRRCRRRRLLSLALLLLAVKLPLPTVWGQVVAVAGLLVLALAQGFVRADVAFALHAGILLVCLTPAGKGFALPRGLQAGTSLVAVLLAVGIQYRLMKRCIRRRPMADTPVCNCFST